MNIISRIDNGKINYTFLICAYFLLGVGGSLFSVVVFCAMIFCLAKYMMGKLPLSHDPVTRALGLSGALYYGSGVLMIVTNLDDAGNYALLWERLPFLAFLPLIAQTRLSDNSALKEGFDIGVMIGGFGIGAWALAALVMGEPRASGMVGNPGPYATAAAFVFAGCVAAAATPGKRRPLLYVIAAGAAAAGIVMSGMRTFLPMIVLAPLLVLVLHHSRVSARAMGGIVIAVALGIGAIALLFGDTVMVRLGDLAQALRADGWAPSALTSIGQRIAIWHCAIDIVPQAPWLGLGRQGAQHFMAACTTDLTGLPLGHTHFHNAVLNALAIGGVVELVATAAMFAVPVWALWRTRSQARTNRGWTILAAMLMTFAMTGALNIFLDQDIHDALFIHATALGMAMVMRTSATADDDGVSAGTAAA